MTPEVRQDYLRVLDIPEFLFSVTEVSPCNNEPIKCLIIEARSKNSFCQPGQSYDLLEKMLGAIDLPMADVRCLCATDQTLSEVIVENPARAILVMDQLATPKLEQLYATHHPQEILNNPTLKRGAWEVLKKVQKCLK
ncbi:MAG: hypothetical protein NZ775_03825 [Gammaproteobacteria bacterium]|nr:hypothetical protein [Gammaproteobacteria bacterium]